MACVCSGCNAHSNRPIVWHFSTLFTTGRLRVYENKTKRNKTKQKPCEKQHPWSFSALVNCYFQVSFNLKVVSCVDNISQNIVTELL